MFNPYDKQRKEDLTRHGTSAQKERKGICSISVNTTRAVTVGVRLLKSGMKTDNKMYWPMLNLAVYGHSRTWKVYVRRERAGFPSPRAKPFLPLYVYIFGSSALR